MATLRRFLIALTVSVLVSLTIAAQVPIRARANVNDVAVNDGAAGEQTFAQIIRSVSPETVRNLPLDYLPEKLPARCCPCIG